MYPSFVSVFVFTYGIPISKTRFLAKCIILLGQGDSVSDFYLMDIDFARLAERDQSRMNYIHVVLAA